jgi:hypothetical protein
MYLFISVTGESEYLDTENSDDTDTGDEDMDPYCGGYNLILTSRYMMVYYVYI